MTVYITKQSNGYIKVSENIKDCEQEGTEILYYLNTSLKKLYQDLRPVVVLDLGDGWYKNQEFIENYVSGKLAPYPLVFVYNTDIENILTKFYNNFDILKKLGHIGAEKIELKNRDKILYRCDIDSALDDTYGPNVVSLVQEFSRVDEKTREFLCSLGTRDLDYFKKSIPELLTKGDDVIKFLPEYYKVYYKTFKLGEPGLSENIKPEFRNSSVLGDDIKKSTELEDFIYSRFTLGQVYPGSDIKSILQGIYSDLGLKRTAKIVDIFDYFEVVKVNLKESSYRLERRKVI